MKYLILTLLTIFVATNMSAQTTQNSISIKSSLWGNSYFIDGKEVSTDDVYTKLISQTESNMLLQKSFSQKSWGWVTLAVGMFFNIGTLQSLYYSFRNDETAPSDNSFYRNAAIAVGFDIAAIIFFSLSKKSFSNSIKSYNRNLNTDSGFNEINLKINGNMITFTYSFSILSDKE
jgi:hypothetical protein